MKKNEIISKMTDEWHISGVEDGDTLLVHSDIRRTVRAVLKQYKQRLEVVDILASFLKAVGKDGTLLLPLFNFDFAKGMPFSMRSTPSQMGALTEAARIYPGAVRTGHPIYSFAVIGSKSKAFVNVDNFSGYGEDSPFGMLRAVDGKIAVMNLPDSQSMTFYHHIEEMNEVDYRYHKTFTAPYTDVEGLTSERTYSLFVRDITRGVQTHVDPTGDLLWKDGLYRGYRHTDGNGLRTISARAMFDYVTRIIRSGNARGLLYLDDTE